MAQEITLHPYVFIPHTDSLVIAAQTDPHNIDKQVHGNLNSPDLASRLDILLYDEVSRIGTPDLIHNHGDPTRPANYYQSCLILATLLGRAYALVAPLPIGGDEATNILSKAASHFPHELHLSIHEEYLASLKTREALWKVISSIFAKGLLSHAPEPGARYVAGLLILTCGKALARTPRLEGRGIEWSPLDLEFSEPDKIWHWKDVVNALMTTESLPRHNADSHDLASREFSTVGKLRGKYFGKVSREEYDRMRCDYEVEFEYVSQEILDVFDAAREHLNNEKENDWGSKDVMDRFLVKLDLQNVFTYEQARERGIDFNMCGEDRLSDYLNYKQNLSL